MKHDKHSLQSIVLIGYPGTYSYCNIYIVDICLTFSNIVHSDIHTHTHTNYFATGDITSIVSSVSYCQQQCIVYIKTQVLFIGTSGL